MVGDSRPGTWWISTGSWSFYDKGSCIAVANEHGKCRLASWYMFSICSSHFLAFWEIFCILSHYLFSSSFACQIEIRKNVGFIGTFPGWSMLRGAIVPDSWIRRECLILGKEKDVFHDIGWWRWLWTSVCKFWLLSKCWTLFFLVMNQSVLPQMFWYQI